MPPKGSKRKETTATDLAHILFIETPHSRQLAVNRTLQEQRDFLQLQIQSNIARILRGNPNAVVALPPLPPPPPPPPPPSSSSSKDTKTGNGRRRRRRCAPLKKRR